MSEIVFSPTIEVMPAIDNVELGLMMQTEPDFVIASGADDIFIESSGYSLTFSPEPASVTFNSFAGLGDEYVWYCPTLETLYPWNCLANTNLNLAPFNATVTSDIDGEAYTFSGSSSSYATNYAKVTNRSEFSYSFWVRGSASDSEVDGVVGQSNINNQRGALVSSYQNSSQGGNGSKATFFYQSEADSYNSDERIQSLRTVFDSTWHHVAVTFKGNSRVNIYIDGVLDNTKSSSIPSQVTDVYQFELGRYAGSNGFAGSLDDVRVFTSVLTADEVAWLATDRGVLGSPPPPPVGLGDEEVWILGDTGMIDISNNVNPVINNGSVTVTDNDGDCFVVSGTKNLQVTGLAQTNDSSISGWVYNPNSGTPCLWTIKNSGCQYYVFSQVFINSDGNYYQQECSGNSVNVALSLDGMVPSNTWTHMCMTMNSTDGLSFYVNGSLFATGPYSPLYFNNPTFLFGGNIGWGASDGNIDDVRRFTRTLTTEEIAWLATRRGIEGPPRSGASDPFISHAFFNARIG